MDRVRKIVVTAGIVALMAGGAVALFAQGAPGRGPGRDAAPLGPGGRAGRGFDAGFALGQLNLSDAQKQQVRDIMQRHDERFAIGLRRGSEDGRQRGRGSAVHAGFSTSTAKQTSPIAHGRNGALLRPPVQCKRGLAMSSDAAARRPCQLNSPFERSLRIPRSSAAALTGARAVEARCLSASDYA